MTQDQIYEELGISGADEETKKRILGNVLTTVEGRFVGTIDDILSDEQAEEMGAIDSLEEVVAWLKTNIPESIELYSDILADHIAELKAQLA